MPNQFNIKQGPASCHHPPPYLGDSKLYIFDDAMQCNTICQRDWHSTVKDQGQKENFVCVINLVCCWGIF